MKHFDKDGNFIERLPEEEEPENKSSDEDNDGPDYVYHYKRGEQVIKQSPISYAANLKIGT